MKYSFDDYSIGLTRKGGRSLATHEIRRPSGITRDEWYTHAAIVCAVLNKTRTGPSDG